LYSDDEQNRVSQQAILRDFLDASKPKDVAAFYLPDLMQAWSFAVQTGNEKLSTAVSSILALLLKTISGQLELRDYGAILCRTLLQRDQVKLFSRGLSAEAHKDHLISPCLRALTEIVSFDGGAFAYQVFERQDSTFNSKFLDRNLRLFKTSGDEDRRKVSVRSNAVRYLLANIRYQPVVNRIRILEYRNLFRTLFDNLKNDSFELVRDVLRSVEAHILRDQEIPRRSKTAIITEKAMISILEVARSEEDTELPDSPSVSSRRKESLGFLIKVSTNRDLGVLLSQGWYPPGSDKDDDDQEDAMDNDDFDMDDYTAGHLANIEIPIRNSILSRFLQALRPHAVLDERELALAIFQAAPELVVDYLYQGRNRFSLEPKLTNTWIGYASFFFSLVELPVPSHFGHGKEYSPKPPPPRIVMENILPSPLSQKVMTRCLNQSSDLIVLFAVRLLTIGLEKFGRVIATYRNISQEHSSYVVAIQKLTAEIQERLPLFKDLVTVTRKAADNNMVLREASTRLVRIYQQTMPQAAAEETFDVAARLTALLEREQDGESTDDSKLLQDLEMQHLLAIAGQSSGMRWWNKQGNLRFSPFTVLLQLSARATSSTLLKNDLETLLKTVACDNGILQAHTNSSAFSALRVSLSAHEDWSPSAATFNFVDECIGRLVKKPVKYMDDLDNIQPDADTGVRKSLSMLVMVCLEQAPFTSRMKSEEQEEILMWMARFFAALENIGEDEAVLKTVKKKLEGQKMQLPKIAADKVFVPEFELPKKNSTTTDSLAVNDHSDPSTQGASFALTEAPEESENRPELRKWQNLDVEEAIQDGVAGRLAVCLCSKYPEIRKQGLTALRGMWKKFPESSYEGKDQADLLVGELIETASGIIDERPMSYIGGSFATHALQVLTDPTHFMFPKVNRYLLKDPTWNIRQLPDYWLGKTILEMPEDDNTYWKELMWVLDMLVDGVRTVDDVGVLRSRNVFERLLALASSPSAGQAVRERIALLIYRSICVGGATLLVTSCGLVSWLRVQRSSGMLSHATVDTFAKAIEGRMDTVKVEEWAGAQLEDELESLKRVAITA